MLLLHARYLLDGTGMMATLTNSLVDRVHSSSPFVIKYIPYGRLSEVRRSFLFSFGSSFSSPRYSYRRWGRGFSIHHRQGRR